MDWSKIEQLIDKYFDGETTLQEEQAIKEALRREDCPTHLKMEGEMMGFFEMERAVESKELDLAAMIKNEEQEQSVSTKPKKKGQLFSLFSAMSGVAAAIAVVFLFFNGPAKTCDDNRPVLAVINNQRICDEQLARQEAQKALQMVAEQLNQGTSKLDYIETLNKPNQIVNK